MLNHPTLAATATLPLYLLCHSHVIQLSSFVQMGRAKPSHIATTWKMKETNFKKYLTEMAGNLICVNRHHPLAKIKSMLLYSLIVELLMLGVIKNQSFPPEMKIE